MRPSFYYIINYNPKIYISSKTNLILLKHSAKRRKNKKKRNKKLKNVEKENKKHLIKKKRNKKNNKRKSKMIFLEVQPL
jgi:hypothetical protein